MSSRVAQVFAKSLPRRGYDEREGQEYMAYYVENTLQKRKILLAEAGVGTGKTFAYLIPVLLRHDWRSMLLRRVVIIATNTIVLQHQLVRDITKLTSILKCGLQKQDLALAKGKSHFLCSARFENVARRREVPVKLRRWARRTHSGDRNEAPECPDKAWEEINVLDTQKCSGCSFFGKCCYENQRKRWRNARLVVTNHQQLIADALIRESNPKAALFPSPDVIVVDEAHRFEDAARQMLGSSFSFEDIKKIPGLVRTLERRLMTGSKSFQLSVSGQELIHLLRESIIWDASGYSGRAFIGMNERLENVVIQYLRQLDSLETQMAFTKYRNSFRQLDSVTTGVSNTLEGLLTPDEYVSWAQMRHGDKVESINVAPRDISTHLSDLFWDTQTSFVLTSATLGDGSAKPYSYTVRSLGIHDTRTFLMRPVPSPFDFESKRLMYIPAAELIPNNKSPEFLDFAVEQIKQLVEMVGGRSLVLFTSHREMIAAGDRLKAEMPEVTWLMQGQAQDSKLIETFKESSNSVLLGTAYWEGLDIPGPALVSVICLRLPFPPQDPILRAKSELVTKQGLDAFEEVVLPDMLMKLKQGLGRLIRTKDDFGIVSILDERAHLHKRKYARLVHEVLKPSEITCQLGQVRKFLDKCREERFQAYLHVDEVARILHCSRSRIYKLLNTGQLKGNKLGRVWRIPAKDVQAFMQRPNDIEE